jgi:hypothetical protein
MEDLWRSESDWYVDGYARRLYEVAAAFYAFEMVTLQTNTTSSVTGNQGRLMSREKAVSNTFLSLIP